MQDTISRARERRRRRANTLYEFEMALREEGLSNFVYDEGEGLIRFCSQIRSHLLYTPLSRKPLPLRSSRYSQGARRPMLLRPPRLLRPVLRGVKTCEASRYLRRSPRLVRHPLPLLRLRRFPPRVLGVLRAFLAHGALLLWSYRLSPIKRARSTVRQE